LTVGLLALTTLRGADGMAPDQQTVNAAMRTIAADVFRHTSPLPVLELAAYQANRTGDTRMLAAVERQLRWYEFNASFDPAKRAKTLFLLNQLADDHPARFGDLRAGVWASNESGRDRLIEEDAGWSTLLLSDLVSTGQKLHKDPMQLEDDINRAEAQYDRPRPIRLQSRVLLAYGLSHLCGAPQASRLAADAAQVRDELISDYGDPSGAFRSVPSGYNGWRSVLFGDGDLESGNALAVRMYNSYAAEHPASDGHERALRILAAGLPMVRQTPEFAGYWLEAARTPGLPAGPERISNIAHLTGELAEPLAAGAEDTLRLTLSVDAPWRVFAHNAGSDDYTGAKLMVDLPEGFKIIRIFYPEGLGFSTFGQHVRTYEGDTELRVVFRAPDELPADAGANCTLSLQGVGERSILTPGSITTWIAFQ
jgi:hypothetical protein